ncbi:hypothetical protein CFRS1_v014952 [Colletotrichum fructicola]|nr:hypothetical protein CFRS1_v016055 [Colletotrichum fructicola]KAF4418762.1 hypothetical protein CFRS1_v014952 [Colletotrichum fructicola]
MKPNRKTQIAIFPTSFGHQNAAALTSHNVGPAAVAAVSKDKLHHAPHVKSNKERVSVADSAKDYLSLQNDDTSDRPLDVEKGLPWKDYHADRHHVKTLGSFVQLLMQKYCKETPGIDDLNRWPPDSAGFTFLVAIDSASSVLDLQNHPLIRHREIECLLGLSMEVLAVNTAIRPLAIIMSPPSDSMIDDGFEGQHTARSTRSLSSSDFEETEATDSDDNEGQQTLANDSDFRSPGLREIDHIELQGTHVPYVVEWKLTANNRTITKDSEHNITITPQALWKRQLKEQVQEVLSRKLPPHKTFRPVDSDVVVSVTDRSQRDFVKRFNELNIDWTLVESQLQEWSHLTRVGKKLRVDVSFNFVLSRQETPSAGRTKRGRRSVSNQMLSNRALQINAKESSTSLASVWPRGQQHDDVANPVGLAVSEPAALLSAATPAANPFGCHRDILDVPGLRDDAMKLYTEWQCSKVRDEGLKLDFRRACDVAL